MIITGKIYTILKGVNISYSLINEGEQIEFSDEFYECECFDTQEELETRLKELDIDFNEDEL